MTVVVTGDYPLRVSESDLDVLPEGLWADAPEVLKVVAYVGFLEFPGIDVRCNGTVRERLNKLSRLIKRQ